MARFIFGGSLVLACLAAAWLDYRIETGKLQAGAISTLQKKGVETINVSWPCQDWLGALFGKEAFQDVEIALFPANSEVTAEDLSALASFPNLHQLVLANTNMDDKGMAQVAKLRSLKVLKLQGTRVSDGAMAVVAKLPQLEELVLTKTGVTNAGLTHLAALKNLQSVDLKQTRVTHAGVVKQFGPKGPPFFIGY